MSKHTRNISGLLLVDKPHGLTSRQALSRVKRAFQASKAGHTGSLDPLATGMLPICLGEATKFSDYLLTAQKTYDVVGQLGARTDTGDAEGSIIEQKKVTPAILSEIDQVLKKFQGEMHQIPPMYSALKFQGQPLYKLARLGQVIERPARLITIYDLKRLPAAHEEQLALRVTCSKGTYIRTLIEDIGEVLGCGAHVIVLRRLQVNDFQPEAMHDLATIETLAEQGKQAELDQYLYPVAALVDHLPAVIIHELHRQRVCHGAAVTLDDSIQSTGMVRIITENGIFLGIGEIQEHNQLVPKRLLR